MSWSFQEESSSTDALECSDMMLSRINKCGKVGINFFLRQIKENGQIGNETDLGSYCKTLNALIFNGNLKEANLVLNYVINNFFCDNGDFQTNPKTNFKSAKIPFVVFYPYCNEWIIQSAIVLRRFDVVRKAKKYLDLWYNPVANASCIINPYKSEVDSNVNCIFNSAALGTTYLYLGEYDRSIKIGDSLITMINKQKSSMMSDKKIFYLRYYDNGNFIKYIKPQKGVRLIYKVIGTDVKQPWFSIGYSAAFLGLLYEVTKKKKYLKTAEFLLEYALQCNNDIRNTQWSHKLMWSASILGRITNKKKYWRLCYDIANYIIDNQDLITGKTSPIIDQCAEIAFWMPIIALHINFTKNKFGEIGLNDDDDKKIKSKI